MSVLLMISSAPVANASAGTCLFARGGQFCTSVKGDNTHVKRVTALRLKESPENLTAICNYAAWFFYVPPEGGAHDLGYRKRAGCVPGLHGAWFDLDIDRDFAPDTLICAKWFEDDYETFVAEKCVGLSK